MQNFIKVLSIGCCLLVSFSVLGQTVPPRVNQFRFFNKKGKLITSKQKRYQISLKSDYNRHSYREVDSSLMKKGIFQVVAQYGDEMNIEVQHGKQLMEIQTAVQLDSTIFQTGKYYIPYSYQALFEHIKTHETSKIINQNLDYFKVNQLPQYRNYDQAYSYSKDTIHRIACKFWKNSRLKIPLREKPSYLYGFYNDTLSNIIYTWNDHFGYKSTDNGRNWQQIPYPEVLEEKVMAHKYNAQKQRDKYPILKEKQHSIKYLYSKDNAPPILTIHNAWYVKLTVVQDVWCISGQGYILLSSDKGQTWRYYLNENYNVKLLEVIEGRYLFNGNYLYKIKE